MKKLIVLTAILAIAGAANAGVTGEFYVIEENVNSASGTSGIVIDVWGFKVQNNSGHAITNLGLNESENIEFTGPFLQDGGKFNSSLPLEDHAFAGFGTIALDAKVADTFFVGESLQVVFGFEDSSSLSADSIGMIPYWIADGSTETIAVFSVADGTVLGADNFVRATAVAGSEEVGAVTYVPEPATMAVLGLGGVAALIRRRRA